MTVFTDEIKNLLATTAIPAEQLKDILTRIEEGQKAKAELEGFEDWYDNIILASDAYKVSHFELYPPGTEYVYSYIESRGSDRGWKRAVFAGLQVFRKKYLRKRLTMRQKEYAKKIITDMGLPFNDEGWNYIVNDLKGILPIKIRALKEGTVINNKNVLVTVVNTDPKCFWLTNYIETILLRAIWYMTTVATLSFYCKLAIIEAYKKSSDADIRPLVSDLSFKLHDFGARGVSSGESAQLGGMGHLINFLGSDTLEAVEAAVRYYGAEKPAFSIPAAEHSTVTSWGRTYEAEAYARMLERFAKPGSVLAVVSDSYDLFNAVNKIWGEELKQKVIDSGATVVIRPDCYDDQTEILTEHGWVKYPELGDNTKVVQVHDDWETSLVLPQKVVRQQYEGEMIQFSDEKGRLDLLVTPNHRMILSDKIGRFHVREAKNAKFYDNRNIPRIAAAKDYGYHLTPYEQFLIAFQADGSYPSGWFDIENPGVICGHVRTRFQFQKTRKIERLIEICKQAGLHYDVNREEERGKKLDQVTIYVNVPINRPLSKTFDWVNPMKRDFNWCHEFIREVSHWDATERDVDRIKYDTTIPENAEVVQLVAIRGGWGCTYSIHEDSREEHFSDVHSLSITGKIMVGGQAVKKETVQYSGMVYCVRVPTGRIVVRRNRKVVVCGNSGDPLTVPVEVVKRLADLYGFTTNSKGYKVLPPSIRVIQGDGITEETLPIILENLLAAGFSVDNIAFGMGGGLLQLVNRDTLKFAMKCSAISINGEWFDVCKEPKTDPGKRSKKGRFKVVEGNVEGNTTLVEYYTIPIEGHDNVHNHLEVVYLNGEHSPDQPWDEIKQTAHHAALALTGLL